MIGAGTGVGQLGLNAANAGANVIGAGTGVGNLGLGAANAGTNMMSAGTGMATAGQGIVNSANQNQNQSMAVASSLFQPRTFGLSPSDAANISLSNIAGANNMNQFLYSTKVQGAQYNTQIAAQNANAAGAGFWKYATGRQ